MSVEITPDESCPHIESGEAERVGGVHFATAEPPVSVEMCQQCLDGCIGNFKSLAPINADAVEMIDKTLDAEYVEDK